MLNLRKINRELLNLLKSNQTVSVQLYGHWLWAPPHPTPYKHLSTVKGQVPDKEF